MRAIVTVIGEDQFGIIAGVSTKLTESKINILDINQTVMQNIFTMMMLVDTDKMEIGFDDLKGLLDQEGERLNVSIRVQREDLFTSMNRI